MLSRVRTTGLGLAAAVAIGLPAALPGSSQASPQGAGKVALHQDFRFLGACRGATGTPAETNGFAVINATRDRVLATVSLKNDVPGRTYLVHVVQVPSFTGCFAGQHQGTLTVKSGGNGTAHVAVPRVAGTTETWVYLELSLVFGFITEEVPIR